MATLPNKILVGVVDRDDTYTGKLGFVTYPNSKKQPNVPKHSIFGWMERNNSKHPLLDFDNEPTSGFVINKKVGGKKPYYSEYKGRTVKARVYDPRGFEFEIDMENMCHILENNGSYVGKGLEGEFVYAWMGSGSVFLLSCNSPEYKELTTLKADKEKAVYIKAKDLVPKTIYVRENGKLAYYLGNVDILEIYHGVIYTLKNKPHPFYSIDNKAIQYPKDIIYEYTKPYDIDTLKTKLKKHLNRFINSKIYFVTKKSGEIISTQTTSPIQIKVVEPKNKYDSKNYYIDFGKEFNVNTRRILFENNGEYYLASRLIKEEGNYNTNKNYSNIFPIDYNIDNVFYIHGKINIKLDKNNKIIESKFSFKNLEGDNLEKINNTNINIITTKFDILE